ncbi:hypothetical protein EI555_016281, partial [Monodon monoceros]
MSTAVISGVVESCQLSRTTLGQFSQSLDVLCALWFQLLKGFFKRDYALNQACVRNLYSETTRVIVMALVVLDSTISSRLLLPLVTAIWPIGGVIISSGIGFEKSMHSSMTHPAQRKMQSLERGCVVLGLGPSVAEERKLSTQRPKKHPSLEAAKAKSRRRPVERAHSWPLPGLDDIHPYTVLASWAGHGR